MSKYIALPEGVAEKDFDKAIAEFREILGDAAKQKLNQAEAGK